MKGYTTNKLYKTVPFINNYKTRSTLSNGIALSGQGTVSDFSTCNRLTVYRYVFHIIHSKMYVLMHQIHNKTDLLNVLLTLSYTHGITASSGHNILL